MQISLLFSPPPSSTDLDSPFVSDRFAKSDGNDREKVPKDFVLKFDRWWETKNVHLRSSN